MIKHNSEAVKFWRYRLERNLQLVESAVFFGHFHRSSPKASQPQQPLLNRAVSVELAHTLEECGLRVQPRRSQTSHSRL